MDDDSAAVWKALGPLMRNGPAHDVCIIGVIVAINGHEDFPKVVTHVWLDGSKVRLQHEDDSPSLIADGVWTWRFTSARDAVPIKGAGLGTSTGNGDELAFRRGDDEIQAFGFGRLVGPI